MRQGIWNSSSNKMIQFALNNAKLREWGYPGIHRVLFENKRKLKNRHILNGTYGGVRGRLINQGLASYSINV